MLSKTSQYAIRAALELARSSNEDRKVGVTDLSEQLGIPKHFLAKILQKMVRASLISSTKGPHGGFYVSDVNRSTSLEEIVLLFDGEAFFKNCVLGLRQCSSENPCPLHTQYAAYRQGLSFLLKDQSISSLSENLDALNLKT